MDAPEQPATEGRRAQDVSTGWWQNWGLQSHRPHARAPAAMAHTLTHTLQVKGFFNSLTLSHPNTTTQEGTGGMWLPGNLHFLRL